MSDIENLLDEALAESRHGWSIGTFGAIGEFMCVDGEGKTLTRDGDTRTMVTARGAIRVTADPNLKAIAYDTLSSDGETWGQSVAFCLPAPSVLDQGTVRALGADHDAIRPEDRDAQLFDTGTGLGHIQFLLRTRDAGLIAALNQIAGKPLFGPEGGAVMTEVLRAQPQRVVTSPVGRIEIYAPIPQPGTTSPDGPHTHLLPKMLAARRTHAANAPIPANLQPVLMLHPRSPWRDGLGQRVPFDAELDAIFNAMLARYGLAEDQRIRASVEEAVTAGTAPSAFPWPDSRRGRAAARITLRRLARRGGVSIADWLSLYDRAPAEADDDNNTEAEPVHA